MGDGVQCTKVKGETPVPPVFAEEWPPGPTERAELGQEDGQRAQEGSEVRKVQGQTVQEQSRMQRKMAEGTSGVHRMSRSLVTTPRQMWYFLIFILNVSCVPNHMHLH